jgi:hypothetical protein
MKKAFKYTPLKQSVLVVLAALVLGWTFYADVPGKMKQWFYEGNHTKDGCPLVYGTRTFTENGVFTPPEGTSKHCPLLVRGLVVGGGGAGAVCKGSGGEIVAFQDFIISEEPVVVGKSGEASSFGKIIAHGGIKNGLLEKLYHAVPEDKILQMGRYAPSMIDGIPFTAASIGWGERTTAQSPIECVLGQRSDEAGVILNNMGPHFKVGGKGFGAGGEASGNEGIPGVVFLEW